MNPIFRWIGGATLATASALALVATGGVELIGNAAEGTGPSPGTTLAVARTAPETVPPVPAATPESAASNATRPFAIKRVLPIDGPIEYGEWHWDEAGVPDGPLVVTVDLEARVISVFRNGYEIGAAAVMLGTDEHPTPTGTFPILTKERHNVSEKYGDAPMPWTLRLTWDGIAIHGGSEVENGYASHGCIGIPDPLAERLFAVAEKGDLVVITDGRRLRPEQRRL